MSSYLRQPDQSRHIDYLQRRIESLEREIALAGLGRSLIGSWTCVPGALGPPNYFPFGAAGGASARVLYTPKTAEYMVERDSNTIKFLKAGVYRIHAQVLLGPASAAGATSVNIRVNNVIIRQSWTYTQVSSYARHVLELPYLVAVNDYVGVVFESGSTVLYAGGGYNYLDIEYVGAA